MSLITTKGFVSNTILNFQKNVIISSISVLVSPLPCACGTRTTVSVNMQKQVFPGNCTLTVTNTNYKCIMIIGGFSLQNSKKYFRSKFRKEKKNTRAILEGLMNQPKYVFLEIECFCDGVGS